MKKKLIGIILVAAMLISLYQAVTVYAAGTTLSAADADGEKGGTVSVAIKLSDNAGLWAVKFRVGYDHSILTVKEATNGEIFADGDVTPPATLDAETYLYVAAANQLSDVKKNGTVLTLKFAVSDSAELGDTSVSVAVVQAINSNGDDVDVSVKAGSVHIINCVHNKKWQTTVAAKCEEKGLSTQVCTKCGEEFGTREIEATGHKNTEIRNAVAATKTAGGYTGDTYCKDCGTLISRGKETAKLPDKPDEPDEPDEPGDDPDDPDDPADEPDEITVIYGDEDDDGAEYIIFIASSAFANPDAITVDGIGLSKNDYTGANEDTVLVVGKGYISRLTEGEHVIVFKKGDASAEATFAAKKSTSGGEKRTITTGKLPTSTLLIMIVAILAIAAACVFYFTFVKRRDD